MPELKKVEIETEPTPQTPQALPDSQLAMAVSFGQMTETNKQLITEVSEAKAERSQTNSLLQALAADIQEMKSRQDTTSRQTETLNQSLTDVMLTQKTEDLKKDEGVMEITPLTETKIEQTTKIESKPVTAHRSLIHKLIFGNR